MPVQGKIADGVIKIALAGLEGAKAQLSQLQVQTAKLGTALGTIGTASSRGFAVATGSITGFLKAADPVRFEIFTQKLQVLAMYVGLTFIPILQAAIDNLDRLIEVFKNLTDDQREQILHWTKVGLAVLAAGSAVGAVVSVLPKLIGLLRAVQVAVAVLMSSTGIGLVVALAGAALAVLQLTGGLDKLQPVFDKIVGVVQRFVGTAFGPLMDTLTEVGNQLADTFGQVVGELAPVFAQLGAEIGKLVQASLPVFAELGKAFGQVVTQLGAAVAQLLPPLLQIGQVFLQLYVAYVATAAKVWTAIAQAVTAVLPALVDVIGTLTAVVEALAPVFAQLAAVLGEVIGFVVQMQAEVLALTAGVLADLIKILAELFAAFMRVFGPVMVDAIKGVVDFMKACLETVRQIVAAAKELAAVLNSLNPFGNKPVARKGSTGAGDWQGGSGSAGGPEDFGGGRPATTSRGGNGTPPGNRFAPLARPVRVENFGLEDAFKRAQQGASFDPAKIAENERKKLLQDQLAVQQRIAANTSPRPGAESAR